MGQRDHSPDVTGFTATIGEEWSKSRELDGTVDTSSAATPKVTEILQRNLLRVPIKAARLPSFAAANQLSLVPMQATHKIMPTKQKAT